MKWKCLLKDDPKSCEKIREIYSVIKQLKKENKIDKNISLMGGKAGVAFFLFYYGKYC